MTCTCVLRGGNRQQWTGTPDLIFQHHTSIGTLRRSKQAGCTICTALANDLKDGLDLLEDDGSISLAASLSEVKTLGSSQAVYRLDFRLQGKQVHTFVLISLGEPPYYFHHVEP
jgi:hypothetical protein